MDEFYNYAKAKAILQTHAENSVKTNLLHLARILKRGMEMGDVMLQKDDDEHVWRLVKKQGDNEMEEMVFACNRVIGDTDLPPVIRTLGYQWAQPQLFRVGDIVEVQCSVIIVKGKGTKHRMKLVLQAIALLDCEIALEAKRKLSKVRMTEENKTRRLKRKVGYSEDEEDRETMHKKARECQDMDESG
ncbi:hypothetical protein EV421DRAFT_1910700 [Armillaria borealis]|uniref:Uncharacterized protein n=1 Tax=Armillaria borealis TaxID=47425 RepID=A0AA39IZI6_9AGAR|nr:hypothetical protein EV421DRAFT_1910700 [Armillaria borealis]